MILLVLRQNDTVVKVGVFQNIDNAREFAKLIPGYEFIANPEDSLYDEEIIHKEQLGDYDEVDYNGKIYPFSRFTFADDDPVEVEYHIIPQLDDGEKGMVDYTTKVDAYSIESNEVKAYIEMREKGFLQVSQVLKEKGYETERAFAGSEDGEAILYRKVGDTDLHFLSHMDARTVAAWEQIDQVNGWESWVESQLS